MSRCAYCGGNCTAHSDEKSHGICENCLVKVSPNCPMARRHSEAMKRGRKKMEEAGFHNLVSLADGDAT